MLRFCQPVLKVFAGFEPPEAKQATEDEAESCYPIHRSHGRYTDPKKNHERQKGDKVESSKHI